jgi:carboxyl-terminal processing protease
MTAAGKSPTIGVMIETGFAFNGLRLARGAAAFSAMLLLAACAATPPAEQISRQDSAFSLPAATEVIAAGYENIADKYLERLDVRTIGEEGLRGLGAIDPAISIEIGDNAVLLTGDGQPLAREPLPKGDDAYGWAVLTARASSAARSWSEEMRRASPEKIYEAVFDGMLSELDIYSRYSGRDEAQRNRARRDGFGGVGIRFRQKGAVTEVYRVTPETPAAEAGVKPGDIIVSAGGVPLKGLSGRKIVKLLRGPVDTAVELRLSRPGQAEGWTVHLIRRHIVPATVSHTVKDGILYVAVDSFNQKTAVSVKRAILKAKAAGPLKGMVMDLRGNPGGLLANRSSWPTCS